MTKKRQNKVCCEVLGGYWARGRVGLPNAGPIAIYTEKEGWQCYSYFTRDDNMARLLRAEVEKQGMDAQQEFVRQLNVFGSSGFWPFDLMQATPAQQVEAALRALGRWETEAE